MEKKLPKYTNHNGFLMPFGFPVEGYVSGLQYKAQCGDLFISTYPKSGTTWMQSIVYSLLHDGEAFPKSKKMTEEIPHLEEVGKEVAERLNTCSKKFPRILKTHLPYDDTPQHPQAKYIYVARNPKDVLVSFYFHTKGFIKHYDFEDGKLEDYADIFLEGKVDFGDYYSHLVSWLQHRKDSNLLFLTYENMKDNPKAAVEEVARFLEIEYNDDLIQRVLSHSSFSSMKKDPSRWSSLRDEKKHTGFIRKGQKGNWREHLSVKHSLALEARLKAALEDLDGTNTKGEKLNAKKQKLECQWGSYGPWSEDDIKETRTTEK